MVHSTYYKNFETIGHSVYHIILIISLCILIYFAYADCRIIQYIVVNRFKNCRHIIHKDLNMVIISEYDRGSVDFWQKIESTPPLRTFRYCRVIFAVISKCTRRPKRPNFYTIFIKFAINVDNGTFYVL